MYYVCTIAREDGEVMVDDGKTVLEGVTMLPPVRGLEEARLLAKKEQKENDGLEKEDWEEIGGTPRVTYQVKILQEVE